MPDKYFSFDRPFGLATLVLITFESKPLNVLSSTTLTRSSSLNDLSLTPQRDLTLASSICRKRQFTPFGYPFSTNLVCQKSLLDQLSLIQSTFASYHVKKRSVILSLISSHGCTTAKAESAASTIDCVLEEDMPGLSGWQRCSQRATSKCRRCWCFHCCSCDPTLSNLARLR